jgi:putative membrane protein insertion efficiency factor
MAKLLTALLSAPIRAYRALISPLMPHVCRFTPSCSVYALEALKVHGPVKGLWLAVRRLSRCHPITWLGGSSGFDPVPLSKTQHP